MSRGILARWSLPSAVSRSVVVPERELRWRFSRSSGPGGQSVNTADSRVALSLDLRTTTALGSVQRSRALEAWGSAGRRRAHGHRLEHRSQLKNREAALERMATILAAAIAPPPRKRHRTRPSRSSVERRLADKRRRGRPSAFAGRMDDRSAPGGRPTPTSCARVVTSSSWMIPKRCTAEHCVAPSATAPISQDRLVTHVIS